MKELIRKMKNENTIMVICGAITIIGIVALCLMSCTNEKDDVTPAPTTKEAVTFTTNLMPFVQTYATTSTIDGGNVFLWINRDRNQKKTYTVTANNLTPSTTTDEIYFHPTTPTQIDALFPTTHIQGTTDISFPVFNDETNKDINRDLVHATASFLKQSGNYNLTFKHLFSLLEIEFVLGNTFDDINDYKPIYDALGIVTMKHATFTPELSGISPTNNKKFYFYNGTSPNTFGCVITNDINAKIIISRAGVDLTNKISVKDYIPTIEAGKKYKLTITINQNAATITAISVDTWIDGGNSSITITT